jgi:hypothetical protein
VEEEEDDDEEFAKQGDNGDVNGTDNIASSDDEEEVDEFDELFEFTAVVEIR